MDDRQRLIVRQNAITNATNLFIKLLDVDETLKGLSAEELHRRLRDIAFLNEEWVFRDTSLTNKFVKVD